MEDLRQGKLEIIPHYFEVDLPFYRKHIEGFLPDKVIDIHTHVGNRKGRKPDDPPPQFWPQWVYKDYDLTVSRLFDAYTKLLPGKDISLVSFGHPSRENREIANVYLAKELKRYPNLWGFCLTLPEWDETELSQQMQKGNFCGLKSYSSMVKDKESEEVTILDIFPHAQLKMAEEKGWIVMLHVPGSKRLADKQNIEQLHEICAKYPHLNLIIAHVGRAYYPEVAEKSLSALKDLDMLYYDISANTCQPAFETLLEYVNTDKILYGSDLPIFAMRGKRVWEGKNYINYTYKADWEDEHTRRNPGEEENYTFMLYEEILAFKKAAEKYSLSADQIEDVFYNNALKLLKE